ncbi:hypothetical protein GJG85_17350 [Burkholderia sp. MS389]|nr:hypothetical protein CFB44_21205 [Burkholderia sp. AU31280]QRR15203.1 hypothetical protein GJG85_17350 [Burkholderia sp. MS389]
MRRRTGSPPERRHATRRVLPCLPARSRAAPSQRRFDDRPAADRPLDELFVADLADRVVEQPFRFFGRHLQQARQSARVEYHQRFHRIRTAHEHAAECRTRAEARTKLDLLVAERIVEILDHVRRRCREMATRDGAAP